ncbi:hypothetical protein MOC18_17685 [Bacillus spizizenii]|nr:hypothetical protein [Bacillus spizizenii]
MAERWHDNGTPFCFRLGIMVIGNKQVGAFPLWEGAFYLVGDESGGEGKTVKG